MKPVIALLVLAATSLSGSAFAGKCSVGTDVFNHPAALLDGRVIGSFDSTDSAIAAVGKMRRAGLCSERDTRCGLTTDVFNHPALAMDGKVVASYDSISKLLEDAARMGTAGLCRKESTCSLTTDVFNHPATFADGRIVNSYNSASDAIAGLVKMADAGLCGDFRYDHFDRHDRDGGTQGCQLRGNSVYINNGATLIDSYADANTAQLVFAALIKAGACSR